MKSAKRFFLFFTGSVIFFLIFILVFNFYVDPSNLYLNKIRNENSLNERVKFLINEYELMAIKSLERPIKYSFLKNTSPNQYDCIILGSSRVKRITSSPYGNAVILSSCIRVLNLAVDDASFEDIVTFLYFIDESEVMGKTILVNLDPWTLQRRLGKRYLEIPGAEKLNQDFELKSSLLTRVSLWGLHIQNLISFSQFKESLLLVLENNSVEEVDIFYKSPKASMDIFSKGAETNAFLKDGGYVDARSQIESSHNNWIDLKKLYFRIDKFHLDEGLLAVFKNLSRKSKNNFIFYLAPYSDLLLTEEGKNLREEVMKIESKIYKETSKLGLKVFGSYSPAKNACKKEDFLDAIHPLASCFWKLKLNQN